MNRTDSPSDYETPRKPPIRLWLVVSASLVLGLGLGFYLRLGDQWPAFLILLGLLVLFGVAMVGMLNAEHRERHAWPKDIGEELDWRERRSRDPPPGERDSLPPERRSYERARDD